ncbi:MAG: hypothetical protein VKJ64_21005 [Leptolyngbyaceae bacterium]|nr:hypothetical protein [Leptolyngbyaceae bacterium]
MHKRYNFTRLRWNPFPSDRPFLYRCRYGRLVVLAITSLFIMVAIAYSWHSPIAAQLPPAPARITGPYCHFTETAVAEKATLRQAAFSGDPNAQQQYAAIVQNHGTELQTCRSRTWPSNQAIWLRLYPCDALAGGLDQIFDEIVDRGYNQVYVEAFYNGQVLLPQADNDTVWTSVMRQPGYENRDLLAEAIAKGHERGLKVYAWMFAMNFGHIYANRADRQQSLAVNGYGQTSLSMYEAASLDPNLSYTPPDSVFVDPYDRQAQLDFYTMSQKILARRPDGVLFDYIRYPIGIGENLVANQVQDLWIYGNASRTALLNRALNPAGRQLIQTFLANGSISTADVTALTEEPLWQGRSIPTDQSDPPGGEVPVAERRNQLQAELWTLAVAHATQGVLDFLNVAALSAERQRIPAGAVFFPEANRTLLDGFDSRLQPWNRFPSTLEFHPMSYGVCGNVSCITSLVQRVMEQAPAGTNVRPVLAGTWGQAMSDRPSLEAQMQDIRRVYPQIDTISHFAYSWQHPERNQERQFCQL